MLPLEALYEYNAELNLGKYFPEHHDKVYWLKIVALVDVQRDGFIQWGWHDRDWSIHGSVGIHASGRDSGRRHRRHGGMTRQRFHAARMAFPG